MSSDKKQAIIALMQMIKANEEKTQKDKKLREWFTKLNKDLSTAIDDLRKGA